MERLCDACGDPYEAKTRRSKFCSTACRVAKSRERHRAAADADRAQDAPASVGEPRQPPSTKVKDQLLAELLRLGVAETYEASIAVGIAKQLDAGVVVGAAFVSLSKELDRRVDALRLKAERPDDPVVRIRGALEEHRLRLVDGATG